MMMSSIRDPLYRFAVWVILFQFLLIIGAILVVMLIRWAKPKLQAKLDDDEAAARALILAQMMSPERDVSVNGDYGRLNELSMRALINTFEQVIARVGEHERRVLRGSYIALKIEEYGLLLTRSWFSWRRIEGALILRSAGASSAEDRLIELLKDTNPNVAFYAAWALVRISPRRAQDHIFEYLNDQDAVSFSQKVSVTRELRLELLEQAELLEIFESLDSSLKAVMIEALISSGYSMALPVVRIAIRSENVEIRIAAFKAAANSRLGLSESELQLGLEDTAWPVRAQAVKAVGAARAVNLIPKLCGLLADSEWWVRQNSARVLEQLGARGVEALGMVAQFSEDRFARDTARRVLSESGVYETPTPQNIAHTTPSEAVAPPELLTAQASKVIDPNSAQALKTMEVSQLRRHHELGLIPTPARARDEDHADHSNR